MSVIFCKRKCSGTPARSQWDSCQDCGTFHPGLVSSWDWQEHLQIRVPAHGVQQVILRWSQRPTWRCKKEVRAPWQAQLCSVVTHNSWHWCLSQQTTDQITCFGLADPIFLRYSSQHGHVTHTRLLSIVTFNSSQ